MESDSDETIILDSEDELMEVQEISSEEISNSSSRPYNDNEPAAQFDNERLPVHILSATENNENQEQLLQPTDLQQDDRQILLLEEVSNPAESNDRNTPSPSLLNTTTSNDQLAQVDCLLSKDDSDNVQEESPKKRPRSEYEKEDDGKTCPICFENWTNMGDHRICSLKCGHLFGAECILRWFSIQRKKSCPTCKKKAARSDIRYIYAKKLIAMDVSELEDLKSQLSAMTEQKNKIQIELTRAVCKEHLIMQQLEDLKKKVQQLDSALDLKQRYNQTQTSNEPSSSDTIRMYMDKSLEICKEGGCRVLDYFKADDLIVASMKSPCNLFGGFGVRKVDVATYRPTAFIPLHSMSIRDVCFHTENPWLLSVSLDKSFKIVDTKTNSPVCGYSNGDVPLWSCCWDVNNPQAFYVGKQQGSVLKFDIRQTSEPISTYDVPGDMSPVVSVASVAASPGNSVACGGIVVCKLNSLWVIEDTPNEPTRLPLILEGPFISMKYQNCTRQLLVSTRSNPRVPYSRHHLCNIEVGMANNLLCNTIHCFPGGPMQTLLSRSCIISNNFNYYVAAHQESTKSVLIWSTSSGNKVHSIPTRDPVLDLRSVNKNNRGLLVAITEKKMEFFKFA